MKSPIISNSNRFGIPTMAALLMLALPDSLLAKGPGDHPQRKGHPSGHTQPKKGDHDDHERQIYSSRPRSTFILSLGNGYAGHGYYYGPPDSPYYYQRSEVRYFATREAAPREYYSRTIYQNHSSDASVQRALHRRGYYRGSIDGRIGPQSRRAIARYQRDNGLRATGYVNQALLGSLGLQ